jgi:hypothetical protein
MVFQIWLTASKYTVNMKRDMRFLAFEMLVYAISGSTLKSSVTDPEPDQDLYVFRSTGSGAGSVISINKQN